MDIQSLLNEYLDHFSIEVYHKIDTTQVIKLSQDIVNNDYPIGTTGNPNNRCKFAIVNRTVVCPFSKMYGRQADWRHTLVSFKGAIKKHFQKGYNYIKNELDGLSLISGDISVSLDLLDSEQSLIPMGNNIGLLGRVSTTDIVNKDYIKETGMIEKSVFLETDDVKKYYTERFNNPNVNEIKIIGNSKKINVETLLSRETETRELLTNLYAQNIDKDVMFPNGKGEYKRVNRLEFDNILNKAFNKTFDERVTAMKGSIASKRCLTTLIQFGIGGYNIRSYEMFDDLSQIISDPSLMPTVDTIEFCRQSATDGIYKYKTAFKLTQRGINFYHSELNKFCDMLKTIAIAIEEQGDTYKPIVKCGTNVHRTIKRMMKKHNIENDVCDNCNQEFKL